MKNCQLAILLLTFFFSNLGNAFDRKAFVGTWCGDNDNKIYAFTLNIKKASNLYKGGYATFAVQEDKIDENQDAFSFAISGGNIIKTKLISGISNKVGEIQIKMKKNNTISWFILKYPQGEFYAPKNMTLYKCKD